MNTLALLCIIVIPTDQAPGNYPEQTLYEHEIAHCNGWTHHPQDMNAIYPPRQFVYKPDHEVEIWRFSTKDAIKVCEGKGAALGSYACMWFTEE